MRVGLMNLGDAPRVFHNKLNRPVVVPVGRVVNADLDARVIEGIKFSSRPETVLVCEPDAAVPPEMQAVVELLEVLEFESPQTIVTKFHQIAPANNFDTMHPSRAQVRHALRTMVEDFVAKAHGLEEKQRVRDDVDPEALERELYQQELHEQPPMHPVQREKYEQMVASGVITRPGASALPRETAPAPAREAIPRGSHNGAGFTAPGRKAKSKGKRK